MDTLHYTDLVEQTTGDLAQRAIALAKNLLLRSQTMQSPEERRQQAELERMIGHPSDKVTLVEMTDQAFRTLTPARVADQLTHLLDLQGIPRFFSPLERTMLRGFQSFGEYLPGVAVPMVKEKMRQETSNVILPAEHELLTEHLRKRQQEGVRMNLNLLGEALLGEDEAQRRLQRYVAALGLPDVECISVKITTIYSQVSPIAREHTCRVVADRLELLYRAAMRGSYAGADGTQVSKFVYLDMEEYRDMHLTVAAMQRALEREGLEKARAGVALQAYIPDSYHVLHDLIQWSKRRVDEGGEPLTIRLVKGANMEMERVEASLTGHSQAPFYSKVDTDANFKKMLRLLLDAENIKHVRVGLASHNLFDIALAMIWASELGAAEHLQFEMLEGMANHQRRAIFHVSQSMLLYAPACHREEFLNAIGYLIRRLDENTGEDNFLRHTFQLEPDSDDWHRLAAGFRESLQRIDTVDNTPHRQQNRNLPPAQPKPAVDWQSYSGEPDTDWALPHHAAWAQDIIDRWSAKVGEAAETIPFQVAGEFASPSNHPLRESFDPSRPDVVSCRYVEATNEDIGRALDAAVSDPSHWRKTTMHHRHALLRAAAQLMRERRADLIGAAMLDGGKTLSEADPEVSEAIDFTEFYPLAAQSLLARNSIRCTPRGFVVVVSPWNFPLAIPCGGIASSLAAGNCVILKPASDTVLPAYWIAKCFWDAGVPREALQFLPCSGSRGARHMLADPRVENVILTGGTATARQMLEERPHLHLLAETGGKNATIVTALSDRELAIKHVLHSAFGHAGQKCSATSLLLLEDEVYEDARFRETLADAVRSLHVGSVWDVKTRIGPLIRPPRGELARGMKELEPGESWLVMPERISANRQLYRPGVKWNVKPESFTHRTELFGPVLGVMRYRRLEDAIGIVNATGYGLTSGLESLDHREQELWRSTIRAGNLYINRPTTGAIVLRQPFGGVGSSAYGPGVKAGGPNYVIPLTQIEDEVRRSDKETHDLPETTAVLLATLNQAVMDSQLNAECYTQVLEAAHSQRGAVLEEFSREHDHVQLQGQDNLRSYLPVRQLRIRLDRETTITDTLIALSASLAAGCLASVSYCSDCEGKIIEILDLIADNLPGRVELLPETDEDLALAIREGAVDRLRLLSPLLCPPAVSTACAEAFVSTIREPVVADGYVETLRYLNEQSLSFDYHRYGNLGRRGER